MDKKTTYLLELFHSQVERGNYREASSLLKLLAPRLPSSRIMRLRAKIPNRQRAKHPAKAKKGQKVSRTKKFARSEASDRRSAKPLSKAKQEPITPRSKYFAKSETTKRKPISQEQKKDIHAIVAERKIEYLVHFTMACNVANILRYGLIPRKRLLAKLGHRYEVKVNDQWRFDGHSDASCLSISFPNYRMFFTYRQASLKTPWAVLLINPKVLWEKECAFYNCNAASRRMSKIPVEQLKAVSVFEGLFDDFVDDNIFVKRSLLQLPSFLTTNPQAEVLVFDVIPREDIVAVCLPSPNEANSKYCAEWQGVEIRIESVYFGPRKDSEVWSSLRQDAV
jgi:hypothetical protein